MSYRCPKCDGIVYNRKKRLCALCGAELPASLLFLPPGMAALAAGETEVPIEVLSECWLGLVEARGNEPATREAAIQYFRDGIARGFQVGPLLKWLISWPSERESAFSQVGYSAKEAAEFVETLRTLPVEELGLKDTTTTDAPNGGLVAPLGDPGAAEGRHR
jgi:hypothetical protein